MTRSVVRGREVVVASVARGRQFTQHRLVAVGIVVRGGLLTFETAQIVAGQRLQSACRLAGHVVLGRRRPRVLA